MLATSVESQTSVWVQPSSQVEHNTLFIDEKGERTRTIDQQPYEIEENAIDQLFREEVDKHAQKRKIATDMQKGIPHKKQQIDEVAISLGKSVGEISQMLDITSMLKSKKYMTLHTCTRSQGLQSKGFGFPTPLMVQLKRNGIGEACDILTQGLVDSREVMKKRGKFNQQLLALKRKQHWRIINYTELVSEKKALVVTSSRQAGTTPVPVQVVQQAVQFNMNRIGIDLSFSSCGDIRAGDVEKNFVPLTIIDNDNVSSSYPRAGGGEEFSSVGVNTPLYPVLSAPVYTVRCSVVSTDGVSAGSVLLWDVLQPYYASQAGVPASLEPDVFSESSIHNICIKRQHNLLAQRLFMLLRSDCLNVDSTHQSGSLLPLVNLCTGANRLSLVKEPLDVPMSMSMEDVAADIGSRPPTRLVVQHISLTKIIVQLSFKYSLLVELTPVPQPDLQIGRHGVGMRNSNKLKFALSKTLLSILHKLLTTWELHGKPVDSGVILSLAGVTSVQPTAPYLQEYCSTQVKEKPSGVNGESWRTRFIFELYNCVMNELRA